MTEPASPDPLEALDHDIRAYLGYLRNERGLSSNTESAYGRDLQHFSRWVKKVGLASHLAPSLAELAGFLEHLREAGLAPPSVSRCLSALKGFYRYLRLEERTTDEAVEQLDLPTLWERVPRVLSEDAVTALLQAPTPTDTYFLRDRAILETLYATGCRASELLSLTMEDVHLDSGLCKCLGKGSKERLVNLGRPAIHAIRAYLMDGRPQLMPEEADSPWLFLSRGGKPLDRGMLGILVRKYALRAGLDGRVSPHTFRHSFASHLLARGADLRAVQEMLGHASIRTTQQYTHIDTRQLRDVHRAFHPRGAEAISEAASPPDQAPPLPDVAEAPLAASLDGAAAPVISVVDTVAAETMDAEPRGPAIHGAESVSAERLSTPDLPASSELVNVIPFRTFSEDAGLFPAASTDQPARFAADDAKALITPPIVPATASQAGPPRSATVPLKVILARKNLPGMLAAVAPSDPFALRDRALLEMLYSGWDISEVVSLRLNDVDLRKYTCRCRKIPGKPRALPLGQTAGAALHRYLTQLRHRQLIRVVDAATSPVTLPPWLFLGIGGKQLTRGVVTMLIRHYARKAGLISNEGGDTPAERRAA